MFRLALCRLALAVLLACLATLSPALAGSGGKDEPLQVAREASQRLARLVEEGRPFGPQDAAWLVRLQEAVGRASITIPDPQRPGAFKTVDTSLTVERLNAFPGSARALRDALVTMLHATENRVPLRQLGEIRVRVHNPALGELLRARYEVNSFQGLFEQAWQDGTFGLRVDERTGLASTSGVSSSENPEMSERQWVTDTVRTGEMERQLDPQGWRRALLTLAGFYTNPTEQAAFDRAIANPATYREGGPEEGVAHIFYPNTLQRDPSWFNNKRLESHGLALKALAEALTAGLVRGEPWGFPDSQAVDDRILRSVANLAAYFVAVDYPSAPPPLGTGRRLPSPAG